MQSPSLLGELVVVALKAENLQDQANRKQDPFCVFRVNGVVKRTKIDYGGGSYPVWDDQVNIPLSHGHQSLLVQVFDRDTNPNNFMGEGTIDLSKVLREKEHDGYFLLKHKGQSAGEIYLEMTFYPLEHAQHQQTVRHQFPANHQRPLPPPPQQHPAAFQSVPHPRPLPPHPAPYRVPHHSMPPSQLLTPVSQRPTPVSHRPVPSPHQPVHHQRPSFPQPRPSSSAQTMSHAQPLLSAPYKPASSPRPVDYPPYPYQGSPQGPHQGSRPGPPSGPPQSRPYPMRPSGPHPGGLPYSARPTGLSYSSPAPYHSPMHSSARPYPPGPGTRQTIPRPY